MRRVMILLFALLAGMGTLILLEYRQPEPSVTLVSEQADETGRVLVYSRDLPRGTRVDETGVTWQEQLRSAVSQDAIISTVENPSFPTSLEDKLLRRDVLTNEPVRLTALVDGESGFMALTLNPGMRAVGMSVTQQRLAGGFILPEDRVNVLHTTTGDLDGDGRSSNYTQTILENIRVLAVGSTPSSRITFQTASQQAQATAQQPSTTMLGETITLEMSDEEASVLFTAMASGQISLALRALDDHGPSRVASVYGFEQRPTTQEKEAQTVTHEEPTNETIQDTNTSVAQEITEAVRDTKEIRLVQSGTISFIEVPVTLQAGEQNGR